MPHHGIDGFFPPGCAARDPETPPTGPLGLACAPTSGVVSSWRSGHAPAPLLPIRPGLPRRGRARSRRAPGLGPVLWPEQGPVQEVRLRGAEARALRHPFLPRGEGRGTGRGPDGGALVQPPLPRDEPPAPRPAADHPLRLAHRLPADERGLGRARRGDGRRDPSPEPAAPPPPPPPPPP